MSHLSFCFWVYFCGEEKIVYLCLPTWFLIIGIFWLYHWQRILYKLVFVSGFWQDVYTPWRYLCPHQWLHWKFWSDSHAVSPLGHLFLNFPVDGWISSVVCTSIDCVHSAAIFGVVYCKVALTHILYLIPPSVVYTCPPHMWLWMWVYVDMHFVLM